MPSSAKKKTQTIGFRIGQARRELAVREERDISQGEIADRIDVSQATVNRWENDVEGKRPSDENLAKLAEVLGVTLSWLRYGQEPKFPALEPPAIPAKTRHG